MILIPDTAFWLYLLEKYPSMFIIKTGDVNVSLAPTRVSTEAGLYMHVFKVADLTSLTDPTFRKDKKNVKEVPRENWLLPSGLTGTSSEVPEDSDNFIGVVWDLGRDL
ncbi:hypothetical protein SAY87_018262 [Trapa incisa]|uniref:Uncharacterized protein n=1 Tax=Trapa incisa TaxID=236973 RepID=A0AAN7LAG7_9MYRT|nr:hypothetical protein SAY87_018262 [Trapa incisa]